MKKLAALVLSFGMLFSMAACSGSKVSDDALDKLESSVKKFSEVKNANYSADMDMTVDKENAKIKLYGGFIAVEHDHGYGSKWTEAGEIHAAVC